MHNTLQAANNAEPLQLIGQAITDDLRRFIAEEIAVAIDRRPTEILDRRQVAELLKISLPTLKKRTDDGSIHCTRIGRRVLFDRAQIDALMQSKGAQKWDKKNAPQKWIQEALKLHEKRRAFGCKYTENFGLTQQ